VGERGVVVAEQHVVPADRVECSGPPVGLAGGLVPVDGLPGVVERVAVSALPFQGAGDIHVSGGLTGVVAAVRVRRRKVLHGLINEYEQAA
jgi:hypothetical protein